jgi:hypothetical protein
MTVEATGAAIEAIRGAVEGWLATLDPGLRERATFPFETAERFAWDYRPGDRAGLAIGAMDERQQAAAGSIVAAALSVRSAAEVAAIVSLEPILGELERRSGRPGFERRDPERYWFAVFGDPAGEGPWAWRLGGHHIAIEQTFIDGRSAGAAPSFLGANPAVVPAADWTGDRAGTRALTGEETLARDLVRSLNVEQRRIAVVDPVAPPDIRSGVGRLAELDGIPAGIRHDELERSQQAALESLVRHYVDRSRPELADEEWSRIVDAGVAALTFAWAGPLEPGQGHYYAIRGPRTLVEYDDTQDGANHIHAVWRDPTNDWGEDVLAAHYAAAHR